MTKEELFANHAHFVCPEDEDGYFVMDETASIKAMQEYAKIYGRWLLLNHYGLSEDIVDEDNDGLYNEFINPAPNTYNYY
ncbi:MAG TPA: hypothetical protein VMR70_04025 [Flavisolibacter sp.]|nr:hypothetical protein [Flavisolibacter sp.]